MALPISPVKGRIAPDDVLTAEHVTDVALQADNAVELLEHEHVVTGRDSGKHVSPPAFSATARWRIAAGWGVPEDGDGELVWAHGFEAAPRLVARHPSWLPGSLGGRTYWLVWRIADHRPGRQIVHATRQWAGTALPEKPRILTRGRDGAMWLGTVLDQDDDPRPTQELRDLRAVTLAIVYLPTPQG